MSESHDWETARAATREAVQAAFKPHPQTCPSCGETTETSAALCPVCRSPYAVRQKGFKLTRRNVGVTVAALAVLAILGALIIPGDRRSASERAAAAAAKAKRLQAAEIARLTRDVQPVRAAGPARGAHESLTTYRTRLLGAGQAAITANALQRIKAGTMTGPVKGTECTPFPATPTRAGLEDKPSFTKRRYECIAFERHFPLSKLEGKARTGVIGQPFWLVVDDATSGLVFCKITPRAGEGGRSLADVETPLPCQDPAHSAGG